MEIWEQDREVRWELVGNVYVKTTTITERIPAHDVLTCRWCGDPMFDARADRLYCNPAHKVAGHRWRKAKKTRNENKRG